MKKLFFFFVSVLLFSCNENRPIVPEPPTGGGERKVLVEEFTGVRCSGCPAGSAELENLLGVYGENLVVVSMHTLDFGSPYSESQHDFRTDEGEELVNYLGNPFAYPSAVVNRKDFDGGTYRLQFGKALWGGYIEQELQEEPKISINIEKTYDPISRDLEVRVSGVVAEEDLVGEARLTIMIAESDIVDAQLKEGEGLVLDYNHRHVLRTVLTNTKGDPIGTNMNSGRNYDVTQIMNLTDGWKSEKSKVIAFVNLIDGENKEILQAESSNVED